MCVRLCMPVTVCGVYAHVCMYLITQVCGSVVCGSGWWVDLYVDGVDGVWV